MNNKIKQKNKKFFIFYKFTSKRAQVLPYFFFMCIILVICWAMLLNVAKLTTDRIMMQNAADNAALSAAVYKARVLNVLGAMNFAIGSYMYGPETFPLSAFWTYYKYVAKVTAAQFVAGGPSVPISLVPMGGYPLIPHAIIKPPDSQRKIGGYFDTIKGGNYQVHGIKTMVDSFVFIQDTLMSAYKVNIWALTNRVAKGQEKNKDGELCGPDITLIRSGVNLGLKRNTGAIYCSSDKVGVGGQVIKWAVNALLVIVLKAPVVIQEVYQANDWSSGNKSWLYADKSEFDRSQKIVVLCIKNPRNKDTGGYPIFSNLFGNQWPSIETVAAAGLYNTAGPMFPLSNSPDGKDKISPVLKNYRNARKSGWDAI